MTKKEIFALAKENKIKLSTEIRAMNVEEIKKYVDEQIKKKSGIEEETQIEIPVEQKNTKGEAKNTEGGINQQHIVSDSTNSTTPTFNDKEEKEGNSLLDILAQSSEPVNSTGFESVKNNTTEISDTKPLIEIEKPKRQRRVKKSKLETQIEGHLILAVINFAFPNILTLVFNMFSKKYKIDSNEIMLDEKELEELKPHADAVAEQLKLNFSPITMLMLMCGVTFSQKMMVISAMKKMEVSNEVK